MGYQACTYLRNLWPKKLARMSHKHAFEQCIQAPPGYILPAAAGNVTIRHPYADPLLRKSCLQHEGLTIDFPVNTQCKHVIEARRIERICGANFVPCLPRKTLLPAPDLHCFLIAQALLELETEGWYCQCTQHLSSGGASQKS